MPAALFDVNVWVALAFTTHPHHEIAKTIFESADRQNPAVTCRAIQQSFLRLVTTPAIQTCYGSERITNTMAWDRWQLLLDFPQTLHLKEPPDLEAQWRAFAQLDLPGPKRWMDAYLAAFARNYRVHLFTFDSDFRAFDGLQVRLLQDESDKRRR